MQFIAAIILFWLICHPSYFIWLGDVTGATKVLYEHGYFTAEHVWKFWKGLAFIVGLPIFLGLCLVALAIIGILLQAIFLAPFQMGKDYKYGKNI